MCQKSIGYNVEIMGDVTIVKSRLHLIGVEMEVLLEILFRSYNRNRNCSFFVNEKARMIKSVRNLLIFIYF